MSRIDEEKQFSESHTLFHALDSWRGVCAIFVALYHVNVIGAMYAGHVNGAAIVSNAFLFVDFFFVLSGFVIAHSAIGKINCAVDVGRFLIRRFGRVWPLHMTVLAAFIGVELLKLYARVHGLATDTPPFAGNRSIPGILTSVLLIHSLDVHSQLQWNQPSWSISVEFYTYVFFVLLLVKWRRHLALVSAIVAVLAATIIAKFSKYNMETTVQFGFFRCLYGFFVGVLVYLLYRSRRLRGSSSRPMATAWEILIAATIGIFVMSVGSGTLSLVAPLLFGTAVYVFSSERGMVSKLLLTRPFRAAGERSYSIYITHAFVIVVVADFIRLTQRHFGAERHIDAMVEGTNSALLYVGNEWLSDAMVICYFVVLLIVSSFTYRFIEAPARLWFRKLAASEWKGSARPVPRVSSMNFLPSRARGRWLR